MIEIPDLDVEQSPGNGNYENGESGENGYNNDNGYTGNDNGYNYDIEQELIDVHDEDGDAGITHDIHHHEIHHDINSDPQFNIVKDPYRQTSNGVDEAEGLGIVQQQHHQQDSFENDNDQDDINRFQQFQFHPKSFSHQNQGFDSSNHVTSDNGGFTSNVSLAMTESSYGMPSQVELNTAKAYPLEFHENEHVDDTKNITTTKVDDDPNRKISFKLQDPPFIRERGGDKRFRNDSSEQADYLEDQDKVHDIIPNMAMSPNNNIHHQLSSPLSQVHISDHTKDSPQLPPPVSASSLRRSNITNDEEFLSIRKGLATDLKSPAEYTLHIVFTQFVRHAERKLNLCLECSIRDESQVIDLLAEGSDQQFDKIISSLGYIARKKPKPIIDSVMFWRKSKSEVASLAATEVERVLINAKSNLSKLNQYTPANPGITKNNVNGNNTKSKRSLSLMRTKSLSRITARDHRRNHSASSAVDNNNNDTNIDNGNAMESEFNKQKNYYDDQFNQARDTAIQAERKSLASIYILCRVLIEVVRQTSYDIIGDDLGGKLEEIVYTQLKTTDPISTSESLLRSANWNLFAELLGYMSEKRFLSVSDRFIADLEKIPLEVNLEDEPRLHLLIHGMRYLKLTNYPLEVFEESAEFVESLAKFFGRANNESIILAYCEVLSNLLLPLANILTAETNHPTWTVAIEKIFKKAYFIWNGVNKAVGSSTVSSSNSVINLSPNRGQNVMVGNISSLWECSVNLLTASLSVSTKELFSDNWFEIIEENMTKLKPKVEIEDKTTFITCVARLIWVYIFRLTDTLNNTIKKLDTLFQLLFFSSSGGNKKQQWIVSDTYLINALVEIIRIVGYRHLNYTLDNVLIKLLKQSFNGASLENLAPEKLILIVKSYMTILGDYELGNKPSFPTDEILNKRIKADTHIKNKESLINDDDETHQEYTEFNFIARNSDNALSHEEICRSFGVLLRILDVQYGSEIWPKDSNNQTTPLSSGFSKSQLPFSAFHFGIDFLYQVTKNMHLELFATLIQSIPWTIVPLPSEKTSASGIPFKSVVELLTRNIVNENSRIADASISALKQLASRKNPSSLINIYVKLAFQLTDKPNLNYNSEYLNSEEFQKLLKLYVELLECWLKQFKQLNAAKQAANTTHPLSQDDELMSKDVLNDLYQINYKTDDIGAANSQHKMKPSDELEWKTIITLIEEIEGNGLFFLCSQDSRIRYYGISILRLVEQFDQEIYNVTDQTKTTTPTDTKTSTSHSHSRSSSKFAADIGTRLIHVMERTDFLELIKPFRGDLSGPEKNRLTKLKFKKNILIRLAESDYGIDSTLWFRVYPRLLDIFFESCPMPIALCRSIVCVRLVQMHEQVYDFSDSYKNYTSSLFTRSSNSVPPELLVNQWKLYLIFACCSLTSTNEQKISFPTEPTHGRKKSMQMFIQHQKITSAKSVFRMVLPLLKSQQSMVKDSVITGLSCININIFKSLLETVQAYVVSWDEVSKKTDSMEDRLRVEIVHILSKLTTRFGSHSFIYKDEWIIANFVSIIKSLKNFLSEPKVQISVDFQRLRRFFCTFLEKVFIGLQDKSDLNKWLPFEARIGCFNYLKEWCGYGDSKNLAEERYNSMLQINSSKESATALAILEVERKALQHATLSCMATICSSSITQEIEIPGSKSAVISFDVPGLMNWVHSLLSSTDEDSHEVGKKALSNILKLNLDNDEIYQEVLKQCYVAQDNPMTTQSYFITFVNFLMEKQQSDTIPNDLCSLVNFLLGNDNHEIRVYSMKLLRYLESKYYRSNNVDRFTESISSKTKVVYKKALFDVSVFLSSIHPEAGFDRISYLTMCFSLVGSDIRRDILSSLLPWVQTVELSYRQQMENENNGNSNNNNDNNSDNSDSNNNNNNTNTITNNKNTTTTTNNRSSLGPINNLNSASIMVLNNLFEITVKFSSTILNEVEALWVALGSKGTNFDIIIEYLISNSLERKNATFVGYARQIIDYLSFSHPDGNYMVDKLISNLEPKSMIPPKPNTVIASFKNEDQFPYIANLGKLIPYNEKDASFSLGQLSLIFLVDLFTSHNDRMINHLPLLLHISFSLLDHYVPAVQEAASSLLCNLFHTLAPTDPKVDLAINKLEQKDHVKYLWVYDDLNNDKRGARTPQNMDFLVRNTLEILTPIVNDLQEEWSRVALNWATTCAVRHIACRSFQMFRSLLSILDQPMLKDMLHRLSNTISDDTPDIQGFAIQILMTLNAITAELDSEKLIDFPQLFWCVTACLSTVHEQEFIEVLSAMTKFVSKIDLDSPDTVSCLISTFPPKWEGRFEGLLPIIMVGLRSVSSYEQTMKFLNKLITLKDSEIIGQGDGRLLITIIANLPRFLHELDNKIISQDVENTAMIISSMCGSNGKDSLSKIFLSLAKNRFRSKKDFLVQTISSIKNVFFPEFEAQTLVYLLGFLSNKCPWVKIETLGILQYVFPLVDLQREEFVGIGADLISPLLRLLLTDYAELALEVLDESVSISGSRLDKDVLRMSLGNSSMKKEYEKTATLFGIPEDSGWSIPMPAVTSSTTRNNVHAVFSTCAVATMLEDEKDQQNEDEEFHFHREEYYEPPPGDNSSVNVDEREASLSHMWAALDDFDSFFTKENDNVPIKTGLYSAAAGGVVTGHNRKTGNHHVHSASVDTKTSTNSDSLAPLDSAPFVYDKKASVILNRSLAKTQSNASFKSSLADSIGNTNFSNVSPAVNVNKRSYIPFRGSKNPNKTKDNTTPIMPSSPSFDKQPGIMSSPAMTNSPSSNGISNSAFGSQDTITSGAFETPTMFDSILGGGKKRVRKPIKNSPSLPSETGKTNSDSPPNQSPSGSTPNSAGNKAKDRKRNSQKLKK